MPKKLKPCPFCYEENDLDVWERQGFFTKKPWSVICNFCGAQGPEAESEEKAVEAWNRRAE